MLTLHHLENSQSFRIVWLLEELQADYELKIYARDAVTSLAPAEYKALHPAGTAPIITDGGITLAETNAIIDYILDQYPDSPLRLQIGNPERVNYHYWFHTAQGSLTPMLLMLFIFSRMVEKSPSIIRPMIKVITNKASKVLPRPRVKKLLTMMNEQLAATTWLSGETFTAADIVMVYSLDAVESRMKLAHFEKDYPHIARYLAAIRERSAYQVAMKKVEN